MQSKGNILICYYKKYIGFVANNTGNDQIYHIELNIRPKNKYTDIMLQFNIALKQHLYFYKTNGVSAYNFLSPAMQKLARQ